MKRSAQRFVLGGDADRASVQVALAGHDAADGQQRSGAEAEFVGAENRADQNVAREFQASVHAERDARTETRANQSFVRFAQTDFPGQAGIFDGGERRRAGATIVAADGDDVGAGFGDSGSDDADACAGNQFYADARARIDGAQIVNQLREIFDAVNVVMRRRRNQRSAGRGVANARDVRSDFFRGKLAAFAGLGALRHFDFEFLGVDQIVGSDAETAGSDLLDFVGGFGFVDPEIGIFAAFAGVAPAAELVHGESESACALRD